MTAPLEALASILSGSLSGLAQGFLVIAPQGHGLRGPVERAVSEAYGGSSHPDLRVLAPEGAGRFVVVDRIRDAQTFLASSPATQTSARRAMKTLVILDAHRLHPSAANALLKPLEEPTRHTRILLVTDRPGELPATIRSRCATIATTPSEEDAIAEVRRRLSDAEAESGKPIRPAASKPSKGTGGRSSTRTDAKARPAEAGPDDRAITGALDLACDDPALASAILANDLEPWLRKAVQWLGGDAISAPPLPAMGKSAASAETVSTALQAALVRATRDAGHAPKGWDPERAAAAAWAIMEWSGDIHRAGIDGRSRLHAMMVRARAARPSTAGHGE